jgi:hypothetical protein
MDSSTNIGASSVHEKSSDINPDGRKQTWKSLLTPTTKTTGNAKDVVTFRKRGNQSQATVKGDAASDYEAEDSDGGSSSTTPHLAA